jgi:signal transduction histidine kinase
MDRLEREQRLVAIVRQARHAARLVDDLLVMTRLGAEARERHVVDLGELVRQQLDAIALRRPDVTVTVAVPDGAQFVQVDPDGLRRAVSNLLDNAAIASRPRGEVVVDVRGDGREICMTVLDDGPGVPMDQRERIFDRFVRLGQDRGGEGSGLGLPIARAIARRDGGVVVCLPRTDRPGGRFELTLPAAP